MLKILWFSFKKLWSWYQHLWPVQSLRQKVWFVASPWELNLRNGMIWWDTYERLHLLVLLVSLRRWVFFFARGRGNRFLRYKEVLTQASSKKIMSTWAWFYCEVVFAVNALLICLNIYIFCFCFKYSKINSAIFIFFSVCLSLQDRCWLRICQLIACHINNLRIWRSASRVRN